VAGSIYTTEQNMQVAGIGTVVLTVRKAPNRSGPNAHGELILEDVLHTPNSVCNIMALTNKFMARYPKVFTGGGGNASRGTIKDAQNQNIAYFDPNPKKRFFQVKLSGPPVGRATGPSSFEEDTVYMINIVWSDAEQARWMAYKYPGFSAPYTTKEKKWLEDHYRGEFHFLQTHGLSIYKEEDRNEGRAIVRVTMSRKDDVPNQSTRQLGLSGRMDKDRERALAAVRKHRIDVDAPLTRVERRWLKVRYGGETNLLDVYDLSKNKPEDRKESRAFVRGIMAGEDRKQSKAFVDQLLDSDDDGDSIRDEDGDDDEEEEEEEEEWNPEGHMADRHFDHETLDWIEKHFKHSANFMYSCGLKFYDDEDCRQAVKIAKAMMGREAV
jgi:hypothetical protein